MRNIVENSNCYQVLLVVMMRSVMNRNTGDKNARMSGLWCSDGACF